MASWKIYFIVLVLVPIVGIGMIFKYLINTNKIKPNKISRLFYYDDESFINSWKEAEKRGFFKFTLKKVIAATAIMFIIGIFFIVKNRSMFGYEQSQTLFVALSMGVAFGLIDSLIGWIANQVRDRQLKEKVIAESDKVNRDN